jgi:hypothetical protein
VTSGGSESDELQSAVGAAIVDEREFALGWVPRDELDEVLGV